jgi:hypothetical protein
VAITAEKKASSADFGASVAASLRSLSQVSAWTRPAPSSNSVSTALRGDRVHLARGPTECRPAATAIGDYEGGCNLTAPAFVESVPRLACAEHESGQVALRTLDQNGGARRTKTHHRRAKAQAAKEGLHDLVGRERKGERTQEAGLAYPVRAEDDEPLAGTGWGEWEREDELIEAADVGEGQLADVERRVPARA